MPIHLLNVTADGFTLLALESFRHVLIRTRTQRWTRPISNSFVMMQTGAKLTNRPYHVAMNLFWCTLHICIAKECRKSLICNSNQNIVCHWIMSSSKILQIWMAIFDAVNAFHSAVTFLCFWACQSMFELLTGRIGWGLWTQFLHQLHAVELTELDSTDELRWPFGGQVVRFRFCHSRVSPSPSIWLVQWGIQW